MNQNFELASILIRKAILKDETNIRECAERAYSRYTDLIGRKPAPMIADFRMQILDGKVYIALDGKNVFLGFIVFYPDELGMHIESVAVLPNTAGKGVGRALVHFCELQAGRQNIEVMHLYTNKKMAENLKIYFCLGYTEIAHRIEDGFDRVFFQKNIRPKYAEQLGLRA